MPADPNPQPTCTNPQRLIVPPRARVSNARWDARRMLALAEAGAYPGAQGREQAAEIAYWRQRLVWDGEAEAETD